MIYREGTQLCAGGDIPEHHEEIRNFIERHGLTFDQVKKVRSTCKKTGIVSILLVAKTEVELRGR